MTYSQTLDPLLQSLAARCVAANLQVTTAESCTGGMIAAAITDIAGSSEWFERGFVTYSNAAKQQMLGVLDGTLNAHGAVSAETVREMASGALQRAAADLAVAVSGVAGPGGGSVEKPVGTVYICVASAGGAVAVDRWQFDGNRAEVRQATVLAALKGLIECAKTA